LVLDPAAEMAGPQAQGPPRRQKISRIGRENPATEKTPRKMARTAAPGRYSARAGWTEKFIYPNHFKPAAWGRTAQTPTGDRIENAAAPTEPTLAPGTGQGAPSIRATKNERRG